MLAPAPGELPPAIRYLNRELSWLDFNGRVLARAADADQPLLERAKYLAFWSTNLDEFFQVRVAGLKDQLAAGVAGTTPDGRSPAEQLRLIRDEVVAQSARAGEVFLGGVVPALAAAGIRLSSWDALDDDDRAHLVRVFEEQIFPVLTPLAVDPGHPFPHISDLSLNLGVSIRDPLTGERSFARVKMPALLDRFVVMPDGERFVPLEQVIARHLHLLFAGMHIEGCFPFRVTRNADLTIDEDEADDLLEAVELELRRRRRGRAVRLEVDPSMPDDVRDMLVRELELDPLDVFCQEGPLDLGGLFAVCELDRPELKYEPWQPVTEPRLAVGDDAVADIFAVLDGGDVLVHHPYDSFLTSVEAFIEQAAVDPQVLAIKQTLYRTSGDGAIVAALARAAELGKQVAVLVEVKARFDERRNITWAKALEEAGAHVVYGIVGLKTHAKTALVVRQEDGRMRRYCHIGTGNYNPTTARAYEDLGVLSADPALGADLTDLFNFLTGHSRQASYRKLLVAPVALKARLIELIRAEAAEGERGRIILKMNGLDDPDVIDALYDASSAGVPIDLVVRSICSLRPGLPALSDNIRVRSIVGRYLEHSRIFFFGSCDGGRGAYFIGSADLRRRNLQRRVEVVVPVEDPRLRARLEQVLAVNLADDTSAWTLQPDGTWAPPPARGNGTHERLQQDALARADAGPLATGAAAGHAPL